MYVRNIILYPFSYRMNKLLGDEIEEDDLFWNQDALKEVPTLIACISFLFLVHIYISSAVYISFSGVWSEVCPLYSVHYYCYFYDF